MDKETPSEQLLLSEIQVLLAEKRTYYSILRTGLGVIVAPLTVLEKLIRIIENKNTRVDEIVV